MRILITGAVGFIGSNLVMRLLEGGNGVDICGIDSLNDYYDVNIKYYRLHQIDELISKQNDCKWSFIKGNIADKGLITSVFDEFKEIAKLKKKWEVIKGIGDEDLRLLDVNGKKLIKGYIDKNLPVWKIRIYCPV